MPVSYGPVFITVIHGIITQNYRESKNIIEVKGDFEEKV